MAVGTVGAGRIGTAVLRRLKAFDVKLHYANRNRLPEGVSDFQIPSSVGCGTGSLALNLRQSASNGGRLGPSSEPI